MKEFSVRSALNGFIVTDRVPQRDLELTHCNEFVFLTPTDLIVWIAKRLGFNHEVSPEDPLPETEAFGSSDES